MRHLINLLVHLITAVLRILRPGGVRPSWPNRFLPNINYCEAAKSDLGLSAYRRSDQSSVRDLY